MNPVFELILKEQKFRRGILELILYSSVTQEDCKLPTEKESILSELILAAGEYVTGQESKGLVYDRSSDFEYPHIEDAALDYWLKVTAGHGNKINRVLLDSITKLIIYHWASDVWGDGAHDTELYYHLVGSFDLCICGPRIEKTFSLSMETVRHIEREVLPNLSAEIIEECKKIGAIMRKYINKDLERAR